MTGLSHLDRNGSAVMVDVSDKPATRRQAQVRCVLQLSAEAFEAIQAHRVAKGEALTVAKLAGLHAAKRTDELIPLCHPLPLEHLEMVFEPDEATHTIRLMAQATTTAKTGIEMEAFMAAAIGALALYDMIKSLDPGSTISELQLVFKTGGKQGFDRSLG